jgi:hypothetical protein
MPFAIKSKGHFRKCWNLHPSAYKIPVSMRDFPSFAVAPVMHGELILSPAQKKTLNAYLQKHEGQQVRITLSQPTRGRSKAQNRYYWKIMDLIAAETGNSSEGVHEACKAMFLPRSFITLGEKEVEVHKSTTTLSTLEFCEYMDRISAFAAQELNIAIPLPHEAE